MKNAVKCLIALELFMTYGLGCSPKPLAYETIFEAAEKGNIADVKQHLKRGVAVNTRDVGGETPLMRAAKLCQVEVVSYLVKVGADVNALSERGETPLMMAAFGGDLDILQLLVESGANVNAKDYRSHTALMNACGVLCYIDAVRFLVNNGADVNAKSDDGWTALKGASSAFPSDKNDDTRSAVVKYLKAQGATE